MRSRAGLFAISLTAALLPVATAHADAPPCPDVIDLCGDADPCTPPPFTVDTCPDVDFGDRAVIIKNEVKVLGDATFTARSFALAGRVRSAGTLAPTVRFDATDAITVSRALRLRGQADAHGQLYLHANTGDVHVDSGIRVPGGYIVISAGGDIECSARCLLNASGGTHPGIALYADDELIISGRIRARGSSGSVVIVDGPSIDFDGRLDARPAGVARFRATNTISLGGTIRAGGCVEIPMALVVSNTAVIDPAPAAAC